MPRDPLVVAISAALAEPFEPTEVKFKPQMVKNNSCLAMAYIDARLIQDRLDDVLGVENWKDTYDCLPDGSVVCKLKCKIGDRWITKTDVGSPSEQPDQGDRLKAAFSDALKRAAVKFGIGRYLYRLTAVWVEYDPVKKRIVKPPQLPVWALPRPKEAKAATKPAPEKAKAPVPQKEAAPRADEPKPAPKAEAPKPEVPKPANLPANGQELHRRLQAYDAKLAEEKVCPRGALLAHVTQAGIKEGYTANLNEWTGPALAFAVKVVREFDQSARQGKSEPRNAA
ncbi:MAG: hypothetical protein K2V38_14100 [Gemmataceae bacterium]|nr:hypothetical protein [Gemmataceae bacterium]